MGAELNNIPGETNSVFDLGNIQFANAATYNLIISNSGGFVTNFEEILNQPAPTMSISSVTPNSGYPGGGTSVTIAGTNFVSGATVYFGNAAATSVSVVSATNITAKTPSSAIPGAVNVTVTNGGDYQPAVLVNGFTYYGPPQNFSASASANTSQGAQLSCTGTPDTPYVLQVATNLTPPINWQPVVTNYSDANGNWTYLDPNALTAPALFYRTELP